MKKFAAVRCMVYPEHWQKAVRFPREVHRGAGLECRYRQRRTRLEARQAQSGLSDGFNGF
jgi:hypothetical protein